MGLFGKGNKHQKRGQPGNAGQFASENRGAIAPETGGPSAATQPAKQVDITETAVAETNQQYIAFNEMLEKKKQRETAEARKAERDEARALIEEYDRSQPGFVAGFLITRTTAHKRLPDGGHAFVTERHAGCKENPREYGPTSQTVFYQPPVGTRELPHETGDDLPFDENFPAAVKQKYGEGTLLVNARDYMQAPFATLSEPFRPGDDMPIHHDDYDEWEEEQKNPVGTFIIIPEKLVNEHGPEKAQRIAAAEADKYLEYKWKAGNASGSYDDAARQYRYVEVGPDKKIRNEKRCLNKREFQEIMGTGQ